MSDIDFDFQLEKPFSEAGLVISPEKNLSSGRTAIVFPNVRKCSKLDHEWSPVK